jgi:hypothetical protein
MPLWKRNVQRTPEEQLHRALVVKRTLRAVTKAVSRATDPAALVNHRYPDGTTPLFLALETGKPKVLRFLVARGADVRMFLHRSPRGGVVEGSPGGSF